MHMADALLSPTVGATMWAATGGMLAYCSHKVRKEPDDRKVPLMGVLGAFLFAAQMINFTIPATGSSGHLGGGVLLAILLGPSAAFLAIASVLSIQALFFADGGLLALGCNIFNLGFLPAVVAYPLIYKKIIGNHTGPKRISIAAVITAVVALQLGAFGVVLETVASGVSSLPFATFLTMMQPIHLAIGIVEGLVTATIVSFVHKARPEIMECAPYSRPMESQALRAILFSFLAAALLTGGVISWFASENPDGLEWAITRVTGKKELESSKDGIHTALANLQEKVAVLPDYNFKQSEIAPNEAAQQGGNKIGTTLSGLLGGIITLGFIFIIGLLLKRRRVQRDS